MKHIIPLTICSLAAAGSLYGAVSAHRAYVRQMDVQNARTAAQQAKTAQDNRVALQTAQGQLQTLQAKLDTSHKNCLLGVSAYVNLSAYAKAHMVKPDCSL